MTAQRHTLEQQIVEMQMQAARLSDSEDWNDQCEQALLATAILLHRGLLVEGGQTGAGISPDYR